MNSRNTTVRSSHWFKLPVWLFLTAQLPVGSVQAAPVHDACTATTDEEPRIALISAFSGEADRLINEMRLNDDDNQFAGCVTINGHRFSKGKLRGKDVVVVLTNISIRYGNYRFGNGSVFKQRTFHCGAECF